MLSVKYHVCYCNKGVEDKKESAIGFIGALKVKSSHFLEVEHLYNSNCHNVILSQITSGPLLLAGALYRG